MAGVRKVSAVLALALVVFALAAPALAQMRNSPMTSPAMPVEQSDKGIMAALSDGIDTGMAASVMQAGGLESLIKPEGTYTLFVASDTALKATSRDLRNQMMRDLKDQQFAEYFVKGHLVSNSITPDQMTDGRQLTLMNGKTMTVTRTHGRMMIDDAIIVKAVKTSNGMIYVMDRIPSSIKTMIEQTGTTPVGT